jgi:hypothetical protein
MVHKNVGPFGTSDILIDSGARLALVHEMSSKAKSVGQIRELLQSFEQLPPIERADQEMALRTAVMVDGLRSFDKTRHVNIVAQITKIGQSNSARGPIQKVKSRLGQPDYDLASQSIIEEFETPEQLKPFIDRVVSSVKSAESHDGRGLILLPEHLRGSLGMAKDYLKTQYGIDPDDQNATVRIQEIEQGDNPDLMTQFGLGFEIIEHMRKGPNAQPSDELLNLVAAMVDGAPDPRAVLDNLFKGILRIRKINWQSLDDQRKSWEAVAQAA